MSTKRLQKKKAAMQAKKEKQLKKNTFAAGTSSSVAKSVENAKAEVKKLETVKKETLKVETSKTEPIKVETSKTEPIKVETSKTEPIKVETSKTEPIKVETSKTEPIKVETSKTEPIKVETSKTDPIKVETSKTEPIKVETSKTEPAKVTTSKTEPLKVETSKEDTAYDALYEKRLKHYYNDLKWLYCELFRNHPEVAGTFSSLTKKMKEIYRERSLSMKEADQTCVADPDWFRKTTFTGMAVNPADFADTLSGLSDKLDYISECKADTLYLTDLFQATSNCSLRIIPEIGTSEDLYTLAANCRKAGIRLALEIPLSLSVDDPQSGAPCVLQTPAYFNAMLLQILELANEGASVFSLGVLPMMPEENLWKLHSLLRMTRMVCEIVCPGILLLGETDRPPAEAAAFGGTSDMPELHIVNSTQLMSDLWHTVATKDTALLRRGIDRAADLPQAPVFQNYLRNRNTVRWNLDYDFLKGSFITEGPHRDYLNEFLAGIFPDSFARGEIYVNPETEESELCGTTASLAGIERFDYEGNMEGVSRGIRYDVALHALLLSLPGIPVLRSGDEVGQLNDYTYKTDISKAADPRWLHNGRFNWALARNRADAETIQGRIFNSLEQLESIRASHPVFAPEVSAHTLETWEKALLALVRETSEEKLICIYNFSDQDKVAWINEQDGTYTDLLTGVQRDAQAVEIPAFGFIWLMHTK